jgi:hypothetical protein
MKTKYILATDKTWLPINNGIFHLNSHDIIWAVSGANNSSYCDMLCDVNTHERCIEIETLGARNPLELMMKLDLYPNLYLEI